MNKIASFTVNHLDLLTGVYVSRKDYLGDQVLTTFDLRFTRPNEEPPMDNQKQPNTQQEDRENKRNFERRQSRIEIKMLPRFRHKDLHRFVNRCTESHQQTEK